MNTAEQNPPRNEQHRHATESPLKKPATETAHASADDIARAATDQGADLDTPTPAAPSGAAEARAADQGPTATMQTETRAERQAENQAATQADNPAETPSDALPIHKATRLEDAHPRGIDLMNDLSLDDTVDTDGKNRDAQRAAEGHPYGPDNVVGSQATLVNAVQVPPEGLGGFDSRVFGALPPIALKPGYEMVDRGVVAPILSREQVALFSLGTDEPRAEATGGRPYALNHLRPGRAIEIRPKGTTQH
jgi:hypothetical protein